MLLRRSGEKNDRAYNLNPITHDVDTGGSTPEIGVEEESFLLELAEAVFYGDSRTLSEVREKGLERLGDDALVDAIGVACAFNGITKIASATGLPLDADTETSTVSMREHRATSKC